MNEASDFVQCEIPCNCGVHLMAHCLVPRGALAGNAFVICPGCGSQHDTPSPPLRMFRREGGSWIPVPISS